MSKSKIIYTKTDEAPMLATYSLLPIIRKFTEAAGIETELMDISLAGRIISNFSDYLTENQKQENALQALGEIVLHPDANVIKLPNISASVPQLKAAIEELRLQGFNVPFYPDEAISPEEVEIKNRYKAVLGSAVNPVLREGNSDRRAPKPVKEYARKNPHSMGAWDKKSKTTVATMDHGDFMHNEKSVTVEHAEVINIILETREGNKVLKSGLKLEAGEVIDGTYMDVEALQLFLKEQIDEAKKEDVLFSLHMKATMMKVSDPIIFGHAVKVYFADVFQKYGSILDEAGVDVNNGLGSLYANLSKLPEATQEEIKAALEEAMEKGPDISMVNSSKGITNLHVPSDVIIDASMPAMIRNGGQLWDKNGDTKDALAVIPDSSYAGIYDETIKFCKENGAFDPRTMGSVSNVGLMAQKAEEYGSHDKTFEIQDNGIVKVVNENGTVLMQHKVSGGDIWRMCQTKDPAVKDWVKLAVKRARATGDPAIFWLNEERAHDAQLIKKVKNYLGDHDTDGLEIKILSPEKAIRYSLERMKAGKDTISVTGNVLRDYNTDLFPILELGTSAKMLSIVPLMNGGGLFETGAGGSAPKHVQQFEQENHLRWDSLGEYLALAVSLEHLAEAADNAAAQILADTLDAATIIWLNNRKSPSRKVRELDNRGSSYYLGMYWARELANQNQNMDLKNTFTPLAEVLEKNEDKIIEELNAVQGSRVNIGGYYHPDEELVEAAMRPSKTLNAIIG